MAGCSGPYTRVFFEDKDAARCIRLRDDLAGRGLLIGDVRLPPGDGGLDDLACDIALRDPSVPDIAWTLRIAKFLGPRRMLRQTHVYELTVQRSDPGESEISWQGHLYADSLDTLCGRLVGVWDDLASGRAVEGTVAKEDSHLTRIALCNA